ncbi:MULTISPECIES: 3-ketoacyl-ACP reductase [unclassified Shinella]|uniref:3-ketoacyl-ACP reductase n=1 Tax=unclassified Shinella TaxID=2643062 RepID=UPI00225D7A2B|nr:MULTISPECIES: 3-ketoacyl-ACP reductase [unclassified Shinella]MCO5140747.1 3-ketoacyl-ACP reductase [Shinella sp.]MDC7256564.1 3-ketoacyl-ACP reductase [Shinella sp. YE25]CAI0339437.1 Short chain dehydrogenase family protein [Rhizobiaceae bacterium]CAK7257838.1 3-ketoacyl-ACP reductase [Shinella sp. WSC3-e]
MTTSARSVAIVTGGRRGIGFGIARALAAEGFDIAITGIGGSDAATDTMLADLATLGARAIYLKADLADLSGHAATVAAVEDQLGAIGCLVNNAGIASVVRGDFLDLAPENFDAIVATNLRGTVFFTQAVLKAMLHSNEAARPRSIINITSVSAGLTSPERLDYCMTKAGLAAFSQGLALRLAETGISVFEIRPGIIRSDMTAGVSAKYDTLIGDGLVPMKRWGEPDDIGTAAAALATGKFAFATGSVINLDGGLSIGRL